MTYKANLTHKERRQRRLQIAKEIEEGGTLQDVAYKHNVTVDYVKNLCRKMELYYPQHKKMRLKTFQILADLMNEVTVSSIAKKYQVSVKHIYHIRAMARAVGILKGD